MNTITKTFIQRHVSTDIEARYWDWADSKLTYDEAVARLAAKWDPWCDAVRIVEKTFDPETFTISTKVVKTTERKGWDPSRKIVLKEKVG